MSAAQEERQRKLDERRAMLEAKRVLKFGGAENLARLRREKVEREAEGLLAEVQRGFEPDLVAKDRDPQDS